MSINLNKYNKVQVNRVEKSIINYIIVQRENRQSILGVKERRGPKIYSDHYLVVANIKEEIKEGNLCNIQKKNLNLN